MSKKLTYKQLADIVSVRKHIDTLLNGRNQLVLDNEKELSAILKNIDQVFIEGVIALADAEK